MLTVALNSSGLVAAKNTLNRLCSEIKSSHRCEALARGLGFRTFATLRDAVQAAAPPTVRPDVDAFRHYLGSHDFRAEARSLHLAMASMAIDAIAQREPMFCVHGFGLGPPRRFYWEEPEAQQVLDARFRELRKDLMGERTLQGFLLASAFLERVPRTQSIRREAGSYWIKHIAENYPAKYPEGGTLGPCYVPNGILIAAALHAGFEIRKMHDEHGHLHQAVIFNMSVAALNALNDEFQPDSGRAQDRKRRREARRGQ